MNTVRLIKCGWLQLKLRWWQWAERELCASHKDHPYIVLRIRQLRDAINSNPLRIGAPY
jgi:hypothetical protein